MSKQTLGIRILLTLFRAASRGSSLSEARLSHLTAIEPVVLDELLAALDREGYIDRTSAAMRLTLEGLAVAAAASKRQSRKSIAHAA
jgi:DNA-binding IclR family transcriptional regulator